MFELQKIFEQIDTNGDGSIQRSELKAITQKIGLNLTENELTGLFNYADVNGDGNIDMQEFLNALNGQTYWIQLMSKEIKSKKGILRNIYYFKWYGLWINELVIKW